MLIQSGFVISLDVGPLRTHNLGSLGSCGRIPYLTDNIYLLLGLVLFSANESQPTFIGGFARKPTRSLLD